MNAAHSNPTPIDGTNPDLVAQELDANDILQWKCAFNTQAFEQLNAWISGFQTILKQMVISNFKWYLHSLLYLHTKKVLQRQADAASAAIQEIDDDDNDGNNVEVENDNDEVVAVVAIEPID